MGDHQGSYNGLAFGAGTDFEVTRLRLYRRATNLLTPDLPRYHGGLVGASYEAPRVVEVDFEVAGDSESDLIDKLDDLFSAFSPQVDTELPFVWGLPGQTDRRVVCRPEAAEPDFTQTNFTGRLQQVSFRLLATDPAIFDDTLLTLTLTPFTSATGFSWDAVWPISWGAGGSGGGHTITNAGDFETWPVFRINAPTSGTGTDPVIEHITSGKKLALTANGGVSMSAGQVLEIETHPARRSIAFTTGASRRGKLSSDSDWFALEPGSNELRFRMSGTTTGATVDVEARSARI